MSDALLASISMSDSDGEGEAAAPAAAAPASLDAMLDDMSSDSDNETAAPAQKNLDAMLDDMSSDSDDGAPARAPASGTMSRTSSGRAGGGPAPSSLRTATWAGQSSAQRSAGDWGATLRACLPHEMAGEWEKTIRDDGVQQLRLPGRPRPPSHAYRGGGRGAGQKGGGGGGSSGKADITPEALLETILGAAVKQSGCAPAAAALAPPPELVALYKQQLLADIPQVELDAADVDADRFPALAALRR